MNNIRAKSIFSVSVALIVMFVTLTASAQAAGIIDNAKFVMNNGAAMVSHSRNVTSGVRELYRERQSVRSFIESASTLIQAYRGFAANKSANIPQLVQIASAIDTLVREYNNVGPKASAVFNKIKPDLKFFESMQEVKAVSLGENKAQLQLKTIPDGTIGGLSGLSGWARVLDSVKSKPSNLFRWGKLSDEYKLGKAEGQFALKACQIALEGMSYYDEASRSLTQLLDIRNQISGIVSGDLSALLNAGSTINKIQSAGGTAEHLSALLESATPRFSKRFEELGAAQDAYLKAHQAYQLKYGSGTGNTATTATSNPAETATTAKSTTPRPPTANAGIDVNAAMTAYQKAYQEYTSCVQNQGASQQEIDAAVLKLRKAREQFDRAKAAIK